MFLENYARRRSPRGLNPTTFLSVSNKIGSHFFISVYAPPCPPIYTLHLALLTHARSLSLFLSPEASLNFLSSSRATRFPLHLHSEKKIKRTNMVMSIDCKTKTKPDTLKFLCSYSGKILPRSSDGVLRYVGGLTRVLAVDRSISYAGWLLFFLNQHSIYASFFNPVQCFDYLFLNRVDGEAG